MGYGVYTETNHIVFLKQGYEETPIVSMLQREFNTYEQASGYFKSLDKICPDCVEDGKDSKTWNVGNSTYWYKIKETI